MESVDVRPDVDGDNVSLVEYTIPKPWCGKKLGDLNEPGTFWLTAVTRFGEAQVVDSGAIGQEGDILYFVADVNALDALRQRLEQGPDH